MSLAERLSIGFREYLDLEERSESKHELMDGEIYAMGGASANHVRIAGNIARALGNHLDQKPCDVFQSDMKLKVAEDAYYPDVFVCCAPDDLHPQYREQPILIVEVLSKSTEGTDRGIKLVSYFRLPSLQEYVLIDQGRMEVWLHRRQEQGWLTTILGPDDILELPSVGLAIPVAELYRRVEFDKTR